MNKNTFMHFEEESLIYICSKVQLDTCMFDSSILLTKFGPGHWSRVLFLPFFFSHFRVTFKTDNSNCTNTLLLKSVKVCLFVYFRFQYLNTNSTALMRSAIIIDFISRG